MTDGPFHAGKWWSKWAVYTHEVTRSGKVAGPYDTEQQAQAEAERRNLKRRERQR